jgi:hypothetical protein
MQRFRGAQLLAAAVLLLMCTSASAIPVDGDRLELRRGSLPHLQFYHKFSPQVKEHAEKSGAKWTFPASNTPEYHQALLARDLARHGRNLATSQSSILTFLLGNLTTLLPTDGYVPFWITVILCNSHSICSSQWPFLLTLHLSFFLSSFLNFYRWGSVLPLLGSALLLPSAFCFTEKITILTLGVLL